MTVARAVEVAMVVEIAGDVMRRQWTPGREAIITVVARARGGAAVAEMEMAVEKGPARGVTEMSTAVGEDPVRGVTETRTPGHKDLRRNG